MKYVYKPMKIEAFQLGVDDEPEWYLDNIKNSIIIEQGHGNRKNATIRTLKGNMLAVHGDYIIKGVVDEIFPCKQTIFKKLFNRV